MPFIIVSYNCCTNLIENLAKLANQLITSIHIDKFINLTSFNEINNLS